MNIVISKNPTGISLSCLLGQDDLMNVDVFSYENMGEEFSIMTVAERISLQSESSFTFVDLAKYLREISLFEINSILISDDFDQSKDVFFHTSLGMVRYYPPSFDQNGNKISNAKRFLYPIRGTDASGNIIKWSTNWFYCVG